MNRQIQHYLTRWTARGQAFLRWWWVGLRCCLPARLQRIVRAYEKPKIVLEPDAAGVRVIRSTEEQRTTIGYVPFAGGDADILPADWRAGSGKVVLHVPGEHALAHEILLPLAAEENLHQVLSFEMDRRTPFPAEQVYYAHRVLERLIESGKMRVRLVVVPRPVVDELLERLETVGLVPDAVGVAGEAGGLNLAQGGRRGGRGLIANRLTLALGVLAAVLLVGAVIVPLLQMRSTALELSEKVRAAQSGAEKVLALREQLDTAAESARFIVQKKVEHPRLLDVIEELTRIIPDGTWVRQFQMKGSEVQLRGESSDASSLIQLLEASGLFQGTNFRSPVTRDQRTGKERFHLSAQVVAGKEQ